MTLGAPCHDFRCAMPLGAPCHATRSPHNKGWKQYWFDTERKFLSSIHKLPPEKKSSNELKEMRVEYYRLQRECAAFI